MTEPQVHLAQNVGWVVGIESVQGKSKNGDAVSFTAFTTNVYEKRNGLWLMALHTSRVPQWRSSLERWSIAPPLSDLLPAASGV
jgi:hypothetical protein